MACNWFIGWQQTMKTFNSHNQKNSQELISIITVNFNQAKVTCELLASLRNITYKNIEIIVVDNNSSDESCIMMKQLFPHITLIENKSWSTARSKRRCHPP